MHQLADVLDHNPSKQDLMQRIVSAAVDSTGAVSACLFECTADKQLRPAAIEGLFPPQSPVPSDIREKLSTRTRFIEYVLRAPPFPLGSGLIGMIAQNGGTCLIADARQDPRITRHDDPSLEIRSFLAAPLHFNQRCFGVLALANTEDGAPFDQTDYELIHWIAEQSALALHNADFLQLHIERRRMDLDLALASNIQKMILPSCAPCVPGLDVDMRYLAAQKVGGDLYDFVELGDGRLGVAIADVSGKGIPASLMMATCRSVFRQIARRHDSPAAALTELNEAMQGELQNGMYITAIYAIIDPVESRILFARAGHELPLLVHPVPNLGGPGTEFLHSDGMPVGMVPQELFRETIRDESLPFATGDLFILYTDGITEAPNPEDREYSGARLADTVLTLKTQRAREINDGILESVNHFARGREQRDDYTLVTVRRL